MKQRPTSVTTAFKLLGVTFLLGLPKALVLIDAGLPVWFFAALYISVALLFLGLYKRLNWVRKLYIICCFIGAPLGVVGIFDEFKSGIGWGVLLLATNVLSYWAIVLLMKKPAREWFLAKDDRTADTSNIAPI